MQTNIPLIPVQLDVSTALKLTKNEGMFKERALMARNDVWHRIRILHGAKYDKEYVLKAILTAAEPADLIPVRYQSSGSDDTCFIARNCGPALEKLCKNNLIIRIPNNDPMILVVTLAFASIQDLKVSIQPILLASLTKRYNANSKSLNLNKFHRDEDIAKHVFCPLSQTRTFSHVLRLTKTALTAFEHLNLQNNELVSLTALECANLTSMKSLDLRNNNLLGMETLTPIRSLTVTELWLDGNPLCENYSSAEQYIDSAKKYCPHLTKLDGISLENPNLPLSIDNYFASLKLEKLVKQFANHFFIIYDQIDRMMLRGLYYSHAVYSVTLGLKPGTSNRKNLGSYLAENRNLLTQSDFVKNDTLLYHGSDEIVGALKRLPRCLHDRNSFHYDVIYNDCNTIILNITGILKLNNTEQILSFSRSFILLARSDNEYKIINDQYHVDTSISQMFSTDFDKQPLDVDFHLTGLSPREKKQLISILMKITTMKDTWAQKFLEDVHWNLKSAISNFALAYSSARMPIAAFR